MKLIKWSIDYTIIIHAIIVCMLCMNSCKHKVPVTSEVQGVYLEKEMKDTIRKNHDTIITSNKVTREYHFHDKYITTEINVQPDTIRQVIIREMKDSEVYPWYHDFWKVVSVLSLIIAVIVILIKLFK